jgi:hypothetical protein
MAVLSRLIPGGHRRSTAKTLCTRGEARRLLPAKKKIQTGERREENRRRLGIGKGSLHYCMEWPTRQPCLLHIQYCRGCFQQRMYNHAMGICTGAVSSSGRMQARIGGFERESTAPRAHFSGVSPRPTFITWDPPLSLIFASVMGARLKSA